MKAKDKATRLHSVIVRARGECQAQGYLDHVCIGPLECAHIIRRGYGHVRVELDNALCLCKSVHMHYTSEPIAWAKFVRHELGEPLYDRLRKKSLQTHKVDWLEQVEYLSGLARELGLHDECKKAKVSI